MTRSFERMNQALRADRGLRSTVLAFFALLLLAAWVAWAVETRPPLLKVFSPSSSPGTSVGGG